MCLGGLFCRFVLCFLLFVVLFVFWVGRGFGLLLVGCCLFFVLCDGCLDRLGVILRCFAAYFAVIWS